MNANKEQEIQAALASVSKKDPEALAAMIVEVFQPQHIALDAIGLILNTRSLQPGDMLMKRCRKGITVRTLYPGAIHLSNEVTVEDRAWYNLEGMDVKVHVSEWDLESGQIGTMAEIESEMRAKIRDYYINRVITLVSSLWTVANTPNNYVSVGGPLTAAVLEAGIDEVNYRTGGVRAVIGVKRVMAPITKFAQYTPYVGAPNTWGVPVPSAIEEVRRTGFVGTYYGTTIIGLDQQFDDPRTGLPLLPEHAIAVIGNNVGEFITYGDIKSKSWTDWAPTPPVRFLELWSQFGMIIDRQEGIYIIGDLTI